MPRAGCGAGAEYGVMPVSYTHLDVYKRQVQDVVEAESNLQDMAALLTLAHRNQEPFLHTAVFIEMIANDPEHLRMLQSEMCIRDRPR